jgi:hypothetical protein
LVGVNVGALVVFVVVGVGVLVEVTTFVVVGFTVVGALVVSTLVVGALVVVLDDVGVVVVAETLVVLGLFVVVRG